MSQVNRFVQPSRKPSHALLNPFFTWLGISLDEYQRTGKGDAAQGGDGGNDRQEKSGILIGWMAEKYIDGQ
ncbi:hypothetical protein [Kyrpidia spormannii]|uniref:hypothetical protein n=1 Tax=Kyrpidia spormannii TaxID=2055160 RepID=UPI00147644BF|nr:hypothetical protein [Kyrpidia spormannii]